MVRHVLPGRSSDYGPALDYKNPEIRFCSEFVIETNFTVLFCCKLDYIADSLPIQFICLISHVHLNRFKVLYKTDYEVNSHTRTDTASGEDLPNQNTYDSMLKKPAAV